MYGITSSIMEKDYPRGAITQIELWDFMTYEHVIQKPGPKINFILGRNGSGKSSIVCAIAIGCGSSPSFIGRASSISDYIKHGRPVATIELTLANPGNEPIVLKRVLRRKGSNECYINNQHVSWERYLMEIKDLNIMADNLVQFLPQERVIDFSLMSAIQLLENTEKTIGDVNLEKIHEELKTVGNQWQNEAKQVEQMRRLLDEGKDKEAQLKQDVEALDSREEFLTTMHLAALKKDRLSLVKQQTELGKSKNELEEIDSDIHKNAEVIMPYQKKLSKNNIVSSEACKALTAAKRDVENCNRAHDGPFLTNESENLTKVNTNELALLNAAKLADKTRLDRIKRIRTAKHNLEATADSNFNLEEMKAITLNKSKEQQKLNKDVERLAHAKQECLAERRRLDETIQGITAEIKAKENAEDGLTKFLMQSPQLQQHVQARRWLDTNRHRLRGKVYGPVFTEIELVDKNLQHASIVESVLPYDSRNMYICEEEGDIDLIMKEMIERDKISVPLRKMARSTDSQLRESLGVDPNSFKQSVKCDRLVSELFDAPEMVKRYLCNKLRLHNLPVYDNASATFTEEYLRVMPKNGAIPLAPTAFAGNSLYRFRKTRLSQGMAIQSNEIKPSQLIGRLMNISREKPDLRPVQARLQMRQLELEELKVKEQNLTEQIATVQGEFSRVSKEITESKKSMSDAERLEKRIKECDAEMVKAEGSKWDFEQAKARTASKILQSNVACWKRLVAKNQTVKSTGVLDKTLDVAVEFVRARSDVLQENKALRIALQKMTNLWELYRMNLRNYDRDVTRFKANLSDHIKLLKNVPGTEKAELAPAALAQYLEMPKNIDQLDILHRAKKQQLNAAGEINLNARRDLEKHKNHLIKLEHSITNSKDEITKEKERMAQQRKKWLDSVQELSDKIGRSFSNFYKLMNLSGDVVLERPDNPDNFDKYGFAIKVSYRANRPLETLSGQVHSGGEKSVATALYMLAIQELTKCPFRVVDEINQGMDSTNERRVFKMIVETASRCGGQYFILSPKLLPDLHLTKDVTVTVIFSGAEMHSGSDLDEWSLERIAEKALALRDGGSQTQSQIRLTSRSQTASPQKRAAEVEPDADDEVPKRPAAKRANIEASKKRTRVSEASNTEEGSHVAPKNKRGPVSPKKLGTLNRV